MKTSELPDTLLNRQMTAGHRARKGHDLNAIQVSSDGTLWQTVKLCCGETIPESAPTWEEIVPDKP